MIDSQGNPGMAGSVIGVETELVLDDVIVVGVLMTVVVRTETEVLTTVVVIELVVVTGVDDVEDIEALTLELLDVVEAALVVLLVGVDDVEVVANTPPGGSR
jgi:hypothetical protein